MCGGTIAGPARKQRSSGLSPRVRGNPWTPSASAGCPRSIPACAGEPSLRIDGKAPLKVYPRVCGGTLAFAATCWGVCGLSPRVRGNLWRVVHRAGNERSIPACAGEPPGSSHPATGLWVYPRVCGGTGLQVRWLTAVEGLSPRVRGNLPVVLEDMPDNRSIPACAGEPSAFSSVLPTTGVYPRVCGGTAGCTPAG